jgi:membrane-bound serine protease (ClpP class)
MSTIIALLVFALVMFFAEIFLPGGFLAAIGGLLILAAAVFAYDGYGVFFAAVILLGGGALGVVLFFAEIKLLSKSPMGQQLRLENQISERLNPKSSDDLIGKQGVTLTTLAPTGRVQIDGKVYTAASQGGLVEKGEPISVVRSETFKLIVTKI